MSQLALRASPAAAPRVGGAARARQPVSASRDTSELSFRTGDRTDRGAFLLTGPSRLGDARPRAEYSRVTDPTTSIGARIATAPLAPRLAPSHPRSSPRNAR